MFPLKNTPLLIQCSNCCTLPNSKGEQHLFSNLLTCFLLSFLQESATLLCRLLTKQFLIALEMITLQENATLLSGRASGSYLPLVKASKPGTNLPLGTHPPSPCNVVRSCGSPCLVQTAQITDSERPYNTTPLCTQ